MKYFFAFISVFICGTLYAQIDPLYSQYYFNQLMINPAYAGVYQRMSFSLNSRYQWAGLEGSPLTNTVSASTSLGSHAGLGALIIDDRLGISRNTEFVASGSYFITQGYTRLGFGLQTSVTNFRFNLDNLNPDVLDDPELDLASESFTKPNFGIGMFLLKPFYYVGISIPRILETEVSDGVSESVRYKRHIYVSAGKIFKSILPVDIKLSTLLRAVDGALSADLSGSLIFSDYLIAGITVRNLNSFGVNAQMLVNEKFRVGYSYELPTNGIIYSSTGTHEIMIALDLARLSGQDVSVRFF